MSKFMWGNEKSLSKMPLSSGVNPRNELLKLYDENYTAQRMFLCVIGAEPLDKLEVNTINQMCERGTVVEWMLIWLRDSLSPPGND